MHFYKSPQRLGTDLPFCHQLRISPIRIWPREKQTGTQRRSRRCWTSHWAPSLSCKAILWLFRAALPPPAPVAWTLHLRQHFLCPVAHQIASQWVSTFSLYVEKRKAEKANADWCVWSLPLITQWLHLLHSQRTRFMLVMTCRSPQLIKCWRPKSNALWCQ